jgi:hypothetical protein
MFGNRLGWGISAAMVLAAAGLAYYLFTLGQPTPPIGGTGLAAAAGHLTLGDAARSLLPPVKPLGDAADDYRKAIADLHDHATAYAELATSKDYDLAAVQQLKGFDDLVHATDLPTMDLFRSKPELIVNYDPKVPALDDLRTLGTAALNVAFLASYDKDYKTASLYATAVLAMGYHLYQERLTYDELSAGMSLMSDASARLQRFAEKANDAATVAKAVEFGKVKLAENDRIKQVWKVLSGQGEENTAQHAGDFFELAGDATVDPVWRTEAVRRLGRLKLFAARRADNVRAEQFVRQLADDPGAGPVLHQAAVAARDITSYQNQSQR